MTFKYEGYNKRGIEESSLEFKSMPQSTYEDTLCNNICYNIQALQETTSALADAKMNYA